MYPNLYSSGELTFHSYTVMMTLAFLIGTIGPIWLNRRREHPFRATPVGGIWIFLGGILGAKIWWVVQYGDWEDVRYLQFILNGGLVFFGGLTGGMITAIIYLKILRIPIITGADMIAPFFALAHGIGRIGCFLTGCCWGALTKYPYPWSVQYPKGTGPFSRHLRQKLITSDATCSLPIHPVQLYETFGNVVIFILLMLIYKKHKRTGVVTLSYLMLYGGLRFITEMFRGESNRPVFGWLTASQTVALGMFIFGVTAYLLCSMTLWKRALPDQETEPAPDASAEESPAE